METDTDPDYLSIAMLQSQMKAVQVSLNCCVTASVVWWPEILAMDPEVQASIPRAREGN